MSGFVELLPDRQAAFDAIVERLRAAFSLYGFTPIDTPALELAQVLLAKGGGETEKQIYRLTKGEHELALRFDLTVSLAKYVVMNSARLVFPFRRYQVGKVFRGERAQRGRFREFYQADIDIVGDGELGIINDAEIPSVIYRAFRSLGLGRFVIRVSNRKILSGLAEILGQGDKAAEIMRAIDKLEKVGEDKTLAALTEGLGVPQKAADEIFALLKERGDPLGALSAYAGKNEGFDRGVSELTQVRRYLAEFGVPESNFAIDLSIVRGLDYYTGTVYETTMTDFPEIGSVCSGGRYDDLAGNFTDRKRFPGVGVGVGLTRLFYVLEEQGRLNEQFLTAPADALIIPMTGDMSHGVALATQMRDYGLRAMIYGEDAKLKTKLGYAGKLGIPFAVFIGEDEINSGKCSVKDMDTGEQVSVSAAMACEGIRDKIAAMRTANILKE
jgi:histidyl-tRNA synthetase